MAIFPSITPDNAPKPGAVLRECDARVLQIVARDAPLKYSRSGEIDGNSAAGMISVWLSQDFKSVEVQALIEEARRVADDETDADEMRFNEVLNEYGNSE